MTSTMYYKTNEELNKSFNHFIINYNLISKKLNFLGQEDVTEIIFTSANHFRIIVMFYKDIITSIEYTNSITGETKKEINNI